MWRVPTPARPAAKQPRALRIKVRRFTVGGRHAHFLLEQRLDAVNHAGAALHAETFGLGQQQPAQHQFMHGLFQRIAGAVVMRQFLRAMSASSISMPLTEIPILLFLP